MGINSKLYEIFKTYNVLAVNGHCTRKQTNWI